MRHRRGSLIVLLLGFVLLQCIPVRAEKVTLRLDWSYWGGHAPFFVAADKGYYGERGLDVAIQDGKGSRTTAMDVGAGNDDFGFADSSSVAALISQGLSATVVAMLMGKNPNGIVFLETEKIKGPKDLEGKTIGTSPGGSDATLLGAFLTRNGVDTSKVKLENMPGDAKPAALLSGKVDGISSQGFYNMPILEAQGAKPREILFADFGLPGVNYGIVTSNKMISERPDTVRRFVAGSLEGWDYAIAHPDEAIRILLKRVPLLDPKVSREQFINFQALLHTPNTVGKPLGWQSAEDWKQSLDVLEQYGGMANRKPLNAYFTNDFIPQH
jgi:NitT/TauT family transport system substrate-binding protein